MPDLDGQDSGIATAATVVATVIGTVSTTAGEFSITIDPSFRPALAGLSTFSHVVVTWWADRAEELAGHGPLVVEETPYVDGPARAGVFATRSPLRPTPLGLSVAGIVSIDEAAGRVQLGWIDAVDGTPVIDIKPYFPSSDRVRDAVVPEWCATWPASLEDSADFAWEHVLRDA